MSDVTLSSLILYQVRTQKTKDEPATITGNPLIERLLLEVLSRRTTAVELPIAFAEPAHVIDERILKLAGSTVASNNGFGSGLIGFGCSTLRFSGRGRGRADFPSLSC